MVTVSMEGWAYGMVTWFRGWYGVCGGPFNVWSYCGWRRSLAGYGDGGEGGYQVTGLIVAYIVAVVVLLPLIGALALVVAMLFRRGR